MLIQAYVSMSPLSGPPGDKVSVQMGSEMHRREKIARQWRYHSGEKKPSLYELGWQCEKKRMQILKALPGKPEAMVWVQAVSFLGHVIKITLLHVLEAVCLVYKTEIDLHSEFCFVN